MIRTGDRYYLFMPDNARTYRVGLREVRNNGLASIASVARGVIGRIINAGVSTNFPLESDIVLIGGVNNGYGE